jgi:hypothetical protein
VSTIVSYRSAVRRRHSSVTPETSFGVFLIVQVLLPGSTRSGAYPRKKSFPTVPPDRSSRIGRTTSSVVPGCVVDWSTTSMPSLMFEPTDSAAETM